MTRTALLLAVSLAFVIVLPADDADAQVMVRTETPLQSNTERFYESTSMGWSVRRPGFFASFGTAPVLPPFGGFNPNAGLTTGFSVRAGKWTSNFNFNFSQGISRTSTTVAPTVMSMNGQPASIFSGTVRPFVIGVVPVGGGFGGFNGGLGGGFSGGGFSGGGFGGGFFNVPHAVMAPQQPVGSSLTQRLQERRAQLAASGGKDRKDRTENQKRMNPTTPQTSQERSDAAFAFFGRKSRRTSSSRPAPAGQTRRSTEAEANADPHDQEVAELYYRRGLKAESQSNATLARIYYRQAVGRATGVLKRRIQQRLAGLSRR